MGLNFVHILHNFSPQSILVHQFERKGRSVPKWKCWITWNLSRHSACKEAKRLIQVRGSLFQVRTQYILRSPSSIFAQVRTVLRLAKRGETISSGPGLIYVGIRDELQKLKPQYTYQFNVRATIKKHSFKWIFGISYNRCRWNALIS